MMTPSNFGIVLLVALRLLTLLTEANPLSVWTSLSGENITAGFSLSSENSLRASPDLTQNDTGFVDWNLDITRALYGSRDGVYNASYMESDVTTEVDGDY